MQKGSFAGFAFPDSSVEAAPRFPGATKQGLRCCGFDSRVDRLITDLGVFCPHGHKAQRMVL